MGTTPPILIFGAGPYAALLRKLAQDAGRTVAGFVVDAQWREGAAFEGLPLHDWAPTLAGQGEWLVALGYRRMNARGEAAERITAAGGILATLIDPGARIAHTAAIGPGTVVFPGCVVEHDATLADNVTLWSGGIVCHDTQVGANAYFAPSVTLSGNCRIGARSFLGTRVTAIDGVTVGEGCRVDAGSLLTGDAASHGHYRGAPARRIGEIDPVAGIMIAR